MQTVEHKATKIRSNANGSKWLYRGVLVSYSVTTRKTRKWSAVCWGPNDWSYLRGGNKREMLQSIDKQLDHLGRTVRNGRIVTY